MFRYTSKILSLDTTQNCFLHAFMWVRACARICVHACVCVIACFISNTNSRLLNCFMTSMVIKIKDKMCWHCWGSSIQNDVCNQRCTVREAQRAVLSSYILSVCLFPGFDCFVLLWSATLRATLAVWIGLQSCDNSFRYRMESTAQCCTGNCSTFVQNTSCTLSLTSAPHPGTYLGSRAVYEVRHSLFKETMINKYNTKKSVILISARS